MIGRLHWFLHNPNSMRTLLHSRSWWASSRPLRNHAYTKPYTHKFDLWQCFGFSFVDHLLCIFPQGQAMMWISRTFWWRQCSWGVVPCATPAGLSMCWRQRLLVSVTSPSPYILISTPLSAKWQNAYLYHFAMCPISIPLCAFVFQCSSHCSLC